ncbi:MAG: protein kinase [candidate division KSB1 bacterium]|jgi:serine/threonine-protein kinase|nr:protein kinase [candidate division KSB1 bacterium]
MIGTKISHYEIIEKIGEGGMGVVYKARDTKLDRIVALKFLHSDLTDDPDAKDRLVQEARAAARLDHPNICTVYEIDDSNEHTFISMSYIEGQNLNDIIESGSLPTQVATDIALQVADGLREAHDKGIIHRDIKSANIMVTESGQVKIMDFGLVKFTGKKKMTKTGTMLGTVSYMSPEQACGEEVDHRSDIWSFGVMFYEMLTGQLPFSGELERTVMYRIVNEEPYPLCGSKEGLPEYLENIVAKCLEKDRTRRYASSLEIIDDLNLRASKTRGQLQSSGISAYLKKRRHYVLVAFLAICALLILSRYHWFSGTSHRSINAIAILPLANLTGDPEQDFFSDGMTDALINELGKIGQFRVISRTSVMQYKKIPKPIPTIAEELNVNAVVEGSAIQYGDSVRVNVKLIETDPERQIWSKSYNCDYKDLLSLHSQFAQDIADEVDIKLTALAKEQFERKRQVNPQAYQLYLQGNGLRFLDPRKAVKYYEESIAIDPDFASAYAGLGEIYGLYGAWGVITPREAYKKVKAYTDKALSLDQFSSEAHAQKGTMQWFYEWNWQAAQHSLRRALELNPNSILANFRYGRFLMFMGRFGESIPQTKHTIELNPVNISAIRSLGISYFYYGKYNEGIKALNRAFELNESDLWTNILFAWNYTWNNEYDKAADFIDRSIKLDKYYDPWVHTSLATCQAKLGKPEKAVATIEKLTQLSSDRYIDPFNFAVLHAALDNVDESIFWFKKAYEIGSPQLCSIYVGQARWFENVKNNPNFMEIIDRLNYPEN